MGGFSNIFLFPKGIFKKEPDQRMKFRRTNKNGKFEVKKVKNKGVVSKNVIRVAISPRPPKLINSSPFRKATLFAHFNFFHQLHTIIEIYPFQSCPIFYRTSLSYLKPGEQDRLIVELLSLAAQRGKNTAACRFILREEGRWTYRLLFTAACVIGEWHRLSGQHAVSMHLKEARFRSAPDSAKDQIFAMLFARISRQFLTSFSLRDPMSHLMELL